MSPAICISWADSTFAEAKIPGPARIFCKNPRLLLMLFSFQGRMTEFQLRCAIIASGILQEPSRVHTIWFDSVVQSASLSNFLVLFGLPIPADQTAMDHNLCPLTSVNYELAIL